MCIQTCFNLICEILLSTFNASLWDEAFGQGGLVKASSQKLRNPQNPNSLRLFLLISRLNLDGFKISIHYLKALAKPVKIRYCKLEILHVWQHGSLGNVGRMVRKKISMMALAPMSVKSPSLCKSKSSKVGDYYKKKTCSMGTLADG